MLVLSRRIGEKIVIGGEVVITILANSRGRCKIGIEAPLHVAVDRAEVVNIPSENREIRRRLSCPATS